MVRECREREREYKRMTRIVRKGREKGIGLGKRGKKRGKEEGERRKEKTQRR